MRVFAMAAMAAAVFGLAARAQTPAEVETVVGAMFADAPAAWRSRVTQDETQRLCGMRRNDPTPAEAADIRKRESQTIVFPGDGDVMGDWKRGASIAENGQGGQFTDPPGTIGGGNCYACHQMDPTEIAYGTLGPSLAEYGRLHDYSASVARTVFGKIFNPQAALACSNMPRFGHNHVLTEQQIKDLTAYLMARDSPVNAP